jgi:hypothetical protein
LREEPTARLVAGEISFGAPPRAARDPHEASPP